MTIADLLVPSVGALAGLALLASLHARWPRAGLGIQTRAHEGAALEAPAGLCRLHAVAFLVVVMSLVQVLMTVHPASAAVIFILPELAGGGIAGVWNILRLHDDVPKPFSGVREAELAAAPDRIARWAWLLVPPFLFPPAVFLWLRTHWSAIPELYRVPWGLVRTQPLTRTTLHVAGPLLFAEGLLLLLLILGLAEFYGSRRTRSRSASLGMIAAVMYFVSLALSGAGLLPLIPIPVWIALPFTLLCVAGLCIGIYRMQTDPYQPSETTPEECWTAGAVYHNRQDPALFVEKRSGLGYTLNFGNPWAFVVLTGFIGGTLALVIGLFGIP